MGYVTTAYASQTKWIEIECDACGAHYSCLVEATGIAHDSFLPYSRDSLKEFATVDLGFKLQAKAARYPCPACGTYLDIHVERVRKLARTAIIWVLGVAIFLTLGLLVSVVAPKTPAWILFVLLAAAAIIPRLVCQPLVDKFDPNRDLAKNIARARTLISKGSLRQLPPAIPQEQATK